MGSLINLSLSQASRIGHLMIIILVFSAAIILGKVYPDKIIVYGSYAKIVLVNGCDEGNYDCIYNQLVYRASLSLVLLFSILSIGSYFFDFVNKGMWIMKFAVAIGSFVGFCWVDNMYFSGWAEAARVLSFAWLLIQGLLFLDLAHDSHDVLMAAADDDITNRGSAREVYGFYIFLSVGFLTCSAVGLGYLYGGHTGCQQSLWFTSVTLVMGVLLTVISLLNTVNKGLLTPCLMFAYSVFLCWYALLSSPDENCHTSKYGMWAKADVSSLKYLLN